MFDSNLVFIFPVPAPSPPVLKEVFAFDSPRVKTIPLVFIVFDAEYHYLLSIPGNCREPLWILVNSSSPPVSRVGCCCTSGGLPGLIFIPFTCGLSRFTSRFWELCTCFHNPDRQSLQQKIGGSETGLTYIVGHPVLVLFSPSTAHLLRFEVLLAETRLRPGFVKGLRSLLTYLDTSTVRKPNVHSS